MNTKQVLTIRKTGKLHYIKIKCVCVCFYVVERSRVEVRRKLRELFYHVQPGYRTCISQLSVSASTHWTISLSLKWTAVGAKKTKTKYWRGKPLKSMKILGKLLSQWLTFKSQSVRHSAQGQRENKWPTKHFTKEDIQINKKDMRKYSTILNQHTKMLD